MESPVLWGCEGPRNAEGATCLHLGFLQGAGPLSRQRMRRWGPGRTLGGHQPLTWVAPPAEDWTGKETEAEAAGARWSESWRWTGTDGVT